MLGACTSDSGTSTRGQTGTGGRAGTGGAAAGGAAAGGAGTGGTGAGGASAGGAAVGDGGRPAGDGGTPGLDASAPQPDADESDASARDCVDPERILRDGRCVPRCLPLPGSYVTVEDPPGAPPFGNTVWFDPDILTEEDATAFAALAYQGTGTRTMFDRRVDAFITVEAHLFDARFGTRTHVEIQVNPEFSRTDAETQAARYATVIGRLPAFLFADLDTVWIHAGLLPFGGGNRNLLIHVEQGEAYSRDGVLEETLLHEATHTSIDGHHADQANWLAAQAADGVAISPYARDNPTREDLAETMAPYLAASLRPERLDPGVAESLRGALPNRFKYLDCLELSMATVE